MVICITFLLSIIILTLALLITEAFFPPREGDKIYIYTDMTNHYTIRTHVILCI